MKGQNPSIHDSKDMKGLKSVMYGRMDEQMKGRTSPKQYALVSSSKLEA